MKKRRELLCLLLPLLLVGCGDQKSDSFKISASQTKVELISDVVSIDLSISKDSILNNCDYNNILWSVNDQEHCKIKKVNSYNTSFLNCIWKADFYSAGTYNITASIDGLSSLNSLNITVTKNAESVSQALSSVLNQSGGLRLGATYDIGLNSNSVKEYSIEGADGILQFNKDGKLEVIGMDVSKLTLKKNGVAISDYFYAVGHSILCANIKNELKEKGIIANQSNKVTNEMLKNVTKLSLTKELQNDIECVSGLKYLTELEEIDISNNYLSDVSWLSSCTKLKKVNLSNNLISNFNQIVNNQDLDYLDVSNNVVNDISKIKFMQKITYLDLSNNNIADISDVSTSYGLQSLFLNDNNLTVFTDKLSGLENLKELGVGNCNIPSSDIISLKYLNNLTYLDISGTDPDLNLLKSMNKLKTLKLSNCQLNLKSLNILNNLEALEVLDISNNQIDTQNYKNALDGDKLKELNAFYIGGNAFNAIPDLTSFTKLKYLDLTDSYNLNSLKSLQNLSINTLVIDNCSSLDASLFNEEIMLLKDLNALSIRGGFNFITKEVFDYLCNLVDEGKIKLRILEDNYVDANTIYNYKKAVLFSLDELSSLFVQNDDNSYTLKSVGNCQEIVISLSSDEKFISNDCFNFNIDSSLYKIALFGNKYETYDFHFNILNRKESSFTFDLYSFKNEISFGNGSVIEAYRGSKVIINSCEGENYLRGANGIVYRMDETKFVDKAEIHEATSAFDGYDLTLNVKKNSSISLIGGNGGTGPDAGSDGRGGKSGAWSGLDGGNGATAIKCHDLSINSSNVTIQGGNGGDGGNPNNGGTFEAPPPSGNGGNGGHGVLYSGSCTCNYSILINGGTGGKSGVNGKNFFGTQYVSVDGVAGSDYMKGY